MLLCGGFDYCVFDWIFDGKNVVFCVNCILWGKCMGCLYMVFVDGGFEQFLVILEIGGGMFLLDGSKYVYMLID